MDNIYYLNKNSPCVVTFSSGKGGVGKTLSVINFAIAARSRGKKVLLVDGDLGMSNVDVLLGLNSTKTMSDLIDSDEIGIESLLLDGPLGIKVLPSGSGVSRVQDLSFIEKQILFQNYPL